MIKKKVAAAGKMNKPARLVMALDIAKAVHTPLAPPDISSPKSSLANRSFINWTTAIRIITVYKYRNS